MKYFSSVLVLAILATTINCYPRQKRSAQQEDDTPLLEITASSSYDESESNTESDIQTELTTTEIVRDSRSPQDEAYTDPDIFINSELIPEIVTEVFTEEAVPENTEASISKQLNECSSISKLLNKCSEQVTSTTEEVIRLTRSVEDENNNDYEEEVPFFETQEEADQQAKIESDSTASVDYSQEEPKNDNIMTETKPESQVRSRADVIRGSRKFMPRGDGSKYATVSSNTEVAVNTRRDFARRLRVRPSSVDVKSDSEVTVDNESEAREEVSEVSEVFKNEEPADAKIEADSIAEVNVDLDPTEESKIEEENEPVPTPAVEVKSNSRSSVFGERVKGFRKFNFGRSAEAKVSSDSSVRVARSAQDGNSDAISFATAQISSSEGQISGQSAETDNQANLTVNGDDVTSESKSTSQIIDNDNAQEAVALSSALSNSNSDDGEAKSYTASHTFDTDAIVGSRAISVSYSG